MAPSVQRRKVWLTPTTTVPCSNAAKTRNPLKFAGVPKLPKRCQPLVGLSSPYCGNMWSRYYCLNISFRLSIRALVAKIQSDKVVRWCSDGDFFASFLRPVFPASPLQHISDLHSKFALRPHHVWKTGSMVDIQCAAAEIRRGKKEDRRKPQGKNIMSASATQGCYKERAPSRSYMTAEPHLGFLAPHG